MADKSKPRRGSKAGRVDAFFRRLKEYGLSDIDYSNRDLFEFFGRAHPLWTPQMTENARDIMGWFPGGIDPPFWNQHRSDPVSKLLKLEADARLQVIYDDFHALTDGGEEGLAERARPLLEGGTGQGRPGAHEARFQEDFAARKAQAIKEIEESPGLRRHEAEALERHLAAPRKQRELSDARERGRVRSRAAQRAAQREVIASMESELGERAALPDVGDGARFELGSEGRATMGDTAMLGIKDAHMRASAATSLADQMLELQDAGYDIDSPEMQGLARGFRVDNPALGIEEPPSLKARMREWLAKNKGLFGEEGAITFDAPGAPAAAREALEGIAAGDRRLADFHGISPERAAHMLSAMESMPGDPASPSAASAHRAREFVAANPDVTPDIASSGFRGRVRQLMASRPDLFNEEGEIKGANFLSPDTSRSVFTGEPVPVPERIAMPAPVEPSVASAPLRRLAALGLGEIGGAALGYALDPESTTWRQHTRDTESGVAGMLGLPQRDQMPVYSLTPDREAAVEAVQGMVGFRPGPEVLRARTGGAAYPDWGAEAITSEERRLYLENLRRLGLPAPDWADMTADVNPGKGPARAWAQQPAPQERKPSTRGWAAVPTMSDVLY